MRNCPALVIAFCTTNAIAAPPLNLVGRNVAGEQITVYGVGDPPHEKDLHSVIVIRKDGKETRIKNQKCYDRGGTFSCEPGGTSPLAGAFYRFKAAPSDPTADDSCSGLAVCERGCGPRTPPELIQYYECYDAGECPNFYLEENGGRELISTVGNVTTDNVSLRWSPHLHSIILRTVSQGTRVVARAYWNLRTDWRQAWGVGFYRCGRWPETKAGLDVRCVYKVSAT